jgi:hypothetical protein
MATFEEHIEGLTQIDINASSAPTTNELTEMLKEGLINTINKIIEFRPGEISKFTKTTHDTGAVPKRGKVLSVMREHDSTAVLRMCTPINPSLRYEATDVESLHYRSKYNPGYYELNGSIYVVPAAGGSNNDIVVTQVHYDTGFTAGDDYNATAIENFPLDYEYLVALYAASLAANAAASDIQNNMPEKPITVPNVTFPDVPASIGPPSFGTMNADLPKVPNYVPITPNFDLTKVLLALNNEDIEMADKELELVDKRLQKSDKDKDNNVQVFNKELEVFKADLERLAKNLDRKSQVVATEYKSKLDKYMADISKYEKESSIVMGDFSSKLQKFQQEIGKYAAEVQEVTTKYKWYQDLAIGLMNMYNMGIMGAPQAAPQEEKGEG